MNKQTTIFNLKNTFFTNPHGLSDPGPYSTSAEIGRLAAQVMKIPLIQKIVSTYKYSCLSRGEQESKYFWTNTNSLVKGTDLAAAVPGGFDGVKTGITTIAGPCLTVRHPISGLIITVLNSRTQEAKFVEVVKITQWALWITVQAGYFISLAIYAIS